MIKKEIAAKAIKIAKANDFLCQKVVIYMPITKECEPKDATRENQYIKLEEALEVIERSTSITELRHNDHASYMVHIHQYFENKTMAITMIFHSRNAKYFRDQIKMEKFTAKEVKAISKACVIKVEPVKRNSTRM